ASNDPQAGGLARAAELGVLFRKGDALQALQGVRTVALDKTGTLTEGRPTLTHFETAPQIDRTRLLALIAGAEDRSEHPIARAIVAGAEAEGITPVAPDQFEALTGLGIRAEAGGSRLLIGAARLMDREGIALGPLQARADALAADGHSALFAALDGQIAAVIAVSDPIKASARAAIADLHAQGLRVAMITG
ncbi:MAG: HAD-IC family P-type ATPase, partial [Paracoccus sp. (in: a-proteobacteria)]